MGLLKGQREILLTIAGFFILLPALLLNTLRPFAPSATGEGMFQEMMRWTEANFLWIAIAAVLGALGRLAILILLLSPGRPTVGEALSAGFRLLVLFVVTDILVGLLWLGGFMLFVIPWLYLVGRTFMVEAAFVAERARNPMAALAAGFEASRGNGWRIVLMVAIIYVAGTILTAAVGSIVGVLAALAVGSGLDRFLVALVEAGFGAGLSLVLLLVSVAAWRQLGEQGDVRRGIAG